MDAHNLWLQRSKFVDNGKYILNEREVKDLDRIVACVNFCHDMEKASSMVDRIISYNNTQPEFPMKESPSMGFDRKSTQEEKDIVNEDKSND